MENIFPNRPIFYKLEGKTPIPCKNLQEFVEWGGDMDITKRRVAKDIIDGIEISTIFLGIDHGICNSEPILFETMIFGGIHDGLQVRYRTYKVAEVGHADAVKMVNESIKQFKK